jgi:thiosulfate/3-mercaptopyruvate sulfurtransferase
VKYKLTLSILLLCVTAFAQQSDPWSASAIVAPSGLAAQLKSGPAPHILYVGFPVLFKGAHIPTATFAGPCSKQEGLDLLAQSVKAFPRDAEIVIYCGCCPFVRCPNVRPAYRALKDAGYTNVKVLQLDTNLHTDWVEKGYPVDK